jgi:hypothetical protein
MEGVWELETPFMQEWPVLLMEQDAQSGAYSAYLQQILAQELRVMQMRDML